MSATKPPYTRNFIKHYAVFAASVAIILYLLITVVGLDLSGSILRGAVIGGAIGAMIVPFQWFAQSYRDAEGQRSTGGEAWKFSFTWAALAMLVHIVVAVALFVIGWRIPGILPQEQVQMIGVLIAVALFFQVPIFRLFIWSAFSGIEARERRARGG
ncbi:ABZJ_00895 family protein [Nioella aestuarii]|uniref:ABZJ_00895 family protein n=1 Tax=Nioella aestuarii TaxID=1662864 RepID=UPI003D7F7C72